jgi:hypothetical protein
MEGGAMVTLLTVTIAFVGLSLAGLGLATSAEARRRSAWPVARGTVTGGDVLAIDGHFIGIVRYQYALHSVRAHRSAYRGTEHAVALEGRLESPPYTTRHEAEALLRRYPVGEAVDVRYDPARPTRSTLGPLPQFPLAS